VQKYGKIQLNLQKKVDFVPLIYDNLEKMQKYGAAQFLFVPLRSERIGQGTLMDFY